MITIRVSRQIAPSFAYSCNIYKFVQSGAVWFSNHFLEAVELQSGGPRQAKIRANFTHGCDYFHEKKRSEAWMA
jgi:hypothetical protein